MSPTKTSKKSRMIVDLARRRDGSVAIEFAIVIPVLMVLMLGVVEITFLVRANMKLTYASWMLANMVSQQTNVSNGDLSAICVGAAGAMLPFAPSQFSAGIGSKAVSANWTNNSSCSGDPTALNAAMGLASAPADGSSIIVVSAKYKYQPALNFLITSEIDLTQNVFVRARTDTLITNTP